MCMQLYITLQFFTLKGRALRSGHTKVTITYTHQEILLEASVVIAAYIHCWLPLIQKTLSC